MNEEIIDTNKKATLGREQRKQKEREEEEKIVQYNLEKAQKEAEYQMEQK